MASGDIKQANAASANYTITLTSLATDTNVLAGRQGTKVDNTTNLYLDYLISGFITTGTSPTAGRIEVWAYGNIDDVPTYPDTITGTDGNVTLTTADIKGHGLALIDSMPTDSTSNRKYPFKPTALTSLFGKVPKYHGIFVVHNTAVNLNSTGSNQQITYTPIYATVAP